MLCCAGPCVLRPTLRCVLPCAVPCTVFCPLCAARCQCPLLPSCSRSRCLHPSLSSRCSVWDSGAWTSTGEQGSGASCSGVTRAVTAVHSFRYLFNDCCLFLLLQLFFVVRFVAAGLAPDAQGDVLAGGARYVGVERVLHRWSVSNVAPASVCPMCDVTRGHGLCTAGMLVLAFQLPGASSDSQVTHGLAWFQTRR